VRRAALLVALALAAPAGATAATPRTSLPDIEDEVICVTCNVPLSIAESAEADRERAFIRRRIAAGDTKDEIKHALVAQYGERVLGTPAGSSGIDLAAWLVPGLVVLAGLAGLAVALPRWRRRRADGAPAPLAPALTPADARRLDEELARFDADAPG
jgi:cytochrome c-type biogenesis protein CcmH/NrfF